MSVHMMNVEVAELAGVNAGLIFQSFSYWIDKNAANGKHFHDGLYWTYNSAAAFEKLFPYMSAKTVRSAIDKLVEAGLIVKGNYNQSSYNRTTWYAITEQGMQYVDLPNKGKWAAPEEQPEAESGQMEVPETENESSQKGKSIFPKGQMEVPETENGFAQTGKSIRGTSNIPDTVPVTSFCAEPSPTPSAPSVPPVFQVSLNDNSLFDVTVDMITRWKELYPAVDVEQSMRDIVGWCEANPRLRKTRNGAKRFINAWLAKEQDRGGKGYRSANPPQRAYNEQRKELPSDGFKIL